MQMKLKPEMLVAVVGVALGLTGAGLALSMSADIAEVREQLKAKPNRAECVSPSALEEVSDRASSAYSKAHSAEDKAEAAESKASDAEEAISKHKRWDH
jgi:hypothetical protein